MQVKSPCRFNSRGSDKSVKKKSQLDIIKACELDIDTVHQLKKFSKKIGIDFLCTPFEVESLRSLVSINIEAIKISSCNLTNFPFLKEAAKTKLPILLSTGMASLKEVKDAVKIFKKYKNPLLLFQCTSNYPAKIENANLSVLKTYKKLFNCPVGYSDHTSSAVPAICATTLGAVAIEKHFTLSRSLPGIDQKASIEPYELKELVKLTYQAQKSLGDPIKKRTSDEKDTIKSLRRSLVAIFELKKGQIISRNMIGIKRPGTGLPTKYLPKIIGSKLLRNKKKDDIFKLKDFSRRN